MMPTKTRETPLSSLEAFTHMQKGDSAPRWLFEGVCREWRLAPSVCALTLITVSENATFLLAYEGTPYGVLRVSQPGYVGGIEAVVSEFDWLSSLAPLSEVNLIEGLVTKRGSYVAELRDMQGISWSCVMTGYVEGTILEDMKDPSSYYKTIGRWSALFHESARQWKKPEGFTRFTWDLHDIVGPCPRWGRWENSELTENQFTLLKLAEDEAIRVMSQAPRDHSAWGIIHADLRPSNIMADKTGKLTVLDFDDSGFSWFLYDYAASLSFLEHEPFAPQMAQGWMEGYESVEKLSEFDLEVASALSMLRRLQLLGWTMSHPEDALPADIFKAQLSGTIYCAQSYLKEHTWLLA